MSILDTRATVSLLLDTIGKLVVPDIESPSPLSLLVASKILHLQTIDPLQGRTRGVKALALPQIRSKGNLRDRWHKDRYFGFFYVAQGEADLLFCQKIAACHSGHLGFILPKAQRFYGAASHWERHNIEAANCDLFWVFINEAGGFVHMCWSRGDQHSVSPIIFLPDNGLLPLVELLAGEVESKKPHNSVRFLLWLVFDRLRRNLLVGKGFPYSNEEQPHRNTQQLPVHSISERARHYIEANLGERLTLGKVAQAIHTSRTTLALTFHQDTGETFVTYLTRRRLEVAQHLLKTTSMRMTEIAFHCGFTKPQYFSETFRRYFGMTPREFRKSGR